MSTRCLLALTLVSAIANPAAYARPVVKWCGEPLRAYSEDQKNDRIVELYGTLFPRKEFGPPGFGETPAQDTRWTAWFVKLDYATDVLLQDPDFPDHEPKPSVELEIQVRGKYEFEGGYRKFAGKHVALKGLLWQGSSPADLGNVQLDTKEFQAVGKVACDGRVVSRDEPLH